MIPTPRWLLILVAVSSMVIACTSTEQPEVEPAPDGVAEATEAAMDDDAAAVDEPAPDASPDEDVMRLARFVSLPLGRAPDLLVDDGGIVTVVHEQQVQENVVDVAVTRCLTVACDETVTNVVASRAVPGSVHAASLAGGAPVIAFLDDSTDSAVLLICESDGCEAPVRRSVEAMGGGTVDVAVSPTGGPVLAYLRRQAGGYRVGLVVCDDAECASPSDVVMDEFEGSTGLPYAIGFDDAGAPYVAYNAGKVGGTGSDGPDGTFLSSCATPMCDGGGRAVLVAAGAELVAADVTSSEPLLLVVDGTEGEPNETDRHLELIACTDVGCADPTASRVEVGHLGLGVAAALVPGAAGTPVVVVGSYDGSLSDSGYLRVHACLDPSCSDTTVSTIAGTHVAQLDAAALPDGSLAIAYPSGADGSASTAVPLELAMCPQADCGEEADIADASALRIEAFIDGTSRLVLRGETAFWHHLDWAAPGLWEYSYEPTRIGDIDWFPAWPESGDPEGRFCACDSLPVTGFRPPVPTGDVTITVVQHAGDGEVTVLEQPTAENEYSAVLEFFPTRGTVGAAWYVVDVTWDIPEV